ncbi:MAG: hypothetical protein A3A44_01170 [Candidatus Sungbacteria bacterium RIFCSPLOWO2_01_FULL_60_25]|uniref:Uncharacterized protein n=1 Tax=Candidatus Sungbacteria bacterium RIFCSPLOWO2_01_FULL_60_25 TaxID=1802281 RepID=A0A1G2LBJ9_9BACT|nr:MAG: hypothetical protein A3A44_01170 [Candidatus Sungbacteria bacterium RIFCSPLOWO2_01_FULL_60_25]
MAPPFRFIQLVSFGNRATRVSIIQYPVGLSPSLEKIIPMPKSESMKEGLRGSKEMLKLYPSMNTAVKFYGPSERRMFMKNK